MEVQLYRYRRKERAFMLKTKGLQPKRQPLTSDFYNFKRTSLNCLIPKVYKAASQHIRSGLASSCEIRI